MNKIIHHWARGKSKMRLLPTFLTLARARDYHGFKTIAIDWEGGEINSILDEIDSLKSLDPWSVDDLSDLKNVASFWFRKYFS